MLKENQKAPNFTLQNSNETDVSLDDFKDKWVVLYFYPKDLTPGCTIEAIDFTALEEKFKKLNAVILGISKDSCASHQKFAKKKDLTITLLSDDNLRVQKLYNVWQPKKLMGREFLGTVRTTFLINPDGNVEKIWEKVKTKGHAQAVLDFLGSL